MRVRMAALVASLAFITCNGPSLGQQLSGDGEKPGQRIEVRDLKRDEGGTITLRFQFLNEGDAEISSCSFKDSMDSCGVVGGIHLIDAVNKKKYLVVRDAQKKCVCSNGVDSIRKGGSSNAWAKFPAPPDTVQKITVVVPGFEPIESVPITSR